VLGASVGLNGGQVEDNFFDLFPGVEKEIGAFDIGDEGLRTVNTGGGFVCF
jgi:hypothetical protein